MPRMDPWGTPDVMPAGKLTHTLMSTSLTSQKIYLHCTQEDLEQATSQVKSRTVVGLGNISLRQHNTMMCNTEYHSYFEDTAIPSVQYYCIFNTIAK